MGRGFHRPVGVASDILPKEDVECRYGAARQQVVFGDAEEVDFRQTDECPVAEEHRQHDIDPLREGEHQSDGEDRHRTGHDGRGHYGEFVAQRQRAEWIYQRHDKEQDSECVVLAGAFERGVLHQQLIDPYSTHYGPEKRQHAVIFARTAIDHVIDSGDPEVEKRHEEFHGDPYCGRRMEVE